MKFIIFFIAFLFLKVCNDVSIDQESEQGYDTKIRVVNRSDFYCSDVSLFSMAFDDLKPGDTSDYKVLNYNYLKDEPLLYLTVEERTLGLYLKILEKNKKHTYVIDSLNIPNGMIFISNK